ncbi:hypothetical protein ES332_D05G431000v1 [Gossypium tomentosum]|uniref:non-specific serine/threonine protein kinase n=1 Tax=Gossypium tomentosum TaxID=34277 RepID=A0A5D2L721_GOSTO|nr:hypothetical protein ES332_D05G431000v1 [Gossypium tomentosum]
MQGVILIFLTGQTALSFEKSKINKEELSPTCRLPQPLVNPVVRGNDTDQQALLHFKAKITGDQLRVMESCNGSIHFCYWHGVTCGRKHQRVTKLEVQYLKLSGSLSPYIGNLSFLKELNLAGNSFYNKIPKDIGRIRRLETLKLTNNSFSGEIPSNLSACSKLTFVYARGNQLSGEIPSVLGFLSNLKVLNFGNNSLTGRIPAMVGNLSSLAVLALSTNALTGSIPEALGQLTHLSYFLVGKNAISGIVPISVFNLSNIRHFDIGQNKIQGSLLAELEINMPYVEFFSVGGNQISGQIPTSISNASSLNVLQFQDNRLSGNVPSLEKLDKLFQFLLDANHLGYGGEGDLKFLCSLVNDTKLENLGISENNFGGVFPECVSNFSSAFLYLAIEQNKIGGGIPEGIGNLISLEVFVAYQNQLSGPIPFVIGRLQKLKVFYSHSNFLSGTIPHSIGNLTMSIGLALDANNLQGNIPSSLVNCKNLLGLSISYNNLSGSIPPEVLGLPSLSIILDLSSNHLTGELPREVENLKNLAELHVSQNSCVSLGELYLDGNQFEGSIPPSLSSLKGGVPEFLMSFRSLKYLLYLNLSFNDFEGEIPSEGVFTNASATFVEGNGKLCGGIPELHLSRCNPKTSNKRLKIAIVVVISGVTLALSVLFILCLRKKKEQQPTTCEENSLFQLSYQSIVRATDRFSTRNLVGSGSFGSVYKGIIAKNGLVIAVKVLNLLNRGASRSFLAECEALKNIRHRNLVKILTAISGFDYQENWLHPSVGMNELETTRNLSFYQRVNVAIDVANVLEYLHHHCETSIIHCDLKPSNILLDEEMVGHISDFGLAKIISPNGLKYGMGSELSTKGDVYSYGILLLEIFTGKRPTDEMFKEGLNLHNFVKAALPEQVFEIIDPILLQDQVTRETIAESSLNGINQGNNKHLRCLNSILKIGLTCSAESPSERFDMSDVVTKLCSIRDMLYSTRLHR